MDDLALRNGYNKTMIVDEIPLSMISEFIVGILSTPSGKSDRRTYA